MKHDSISSGKRKPVNVTIDTGIVAAARAVGLNLSQVSEAGLVAAVHRERERQWIEANREAMASSNAWVEKNGLPFAKYRQF